MQRFADRIDPGVLVLSPRRGFFIMFSHRINDTIIHFKVFWVIFQLSAGFLDSIERVLVSPFFSDDYLSISERGRWRRCNRSHPCRNWGAWQSRQWQTFACRSNNGTHITPTGRATTTTRVHNACQHSDSTRTPF